MRLSRDQHSGERETQRDHMQTHCSVLCGLEPHDDREGGSEGEVGHVKMRGGGEVRAMRIEEAGLQP